MSFHDPSLLRFTANTTRFYELLEVDKSASEGDLKRAYKKMAVRHHPDKGGDPEMFKEIVRSYEVLSNSASRAKYDEFGEEGLDVAFSAAGPSSAEAEAEVADRPPGSLAVGACMLMTLMGQLCGVSAAAGVVLCGAGRALQGAGRGGRLAPLALMASGCLLLWPWLGPLEGLSAIAWTVGNYAVTAAGLAVLAVRWEQLPGFLPYLLLAGYLLLFLLVPTRSSERVLMELPGYVLVADGGEVESDCALAESAALFTWGMVAIHWILSRSQHAKQGEKSTEQV